MQSAGNIRLEAAIAQVAKGERSAFTEVYEATSAKLHAVCLSVLKDRPEAEETLQEVYIKIWHDAPRYASNGLSPMAWMITIARNRSIDRLRRRSSLPAVPPTDDPAAFPADLPPVSLDAHIKERMALDKCIAQLGEGQVANLRAAYTEGVTYADLAARGGKSASTMRDEFRRSLLRLKECVITND